MCFLYLKFIYYTYRCNLLFIRKMAYSINRRPLLWGTSDSEFEGDLETEVDDPNTSISDEKPFLKPHEPRDKYVL